MDTLYLAAVCAVVPGLGRSRIPDLINALGSARAVFEASAATLTATGLCTPRAVQNLSATVMHVCRKGWIISAVITACRYWPIPTLPIRRACKT